MRHFHYQADLRKLLVLRLRKFTNPRIRVFQLSEVKAFSLAYVADLQENAARSRRHAKIVDTIRKTCILRIVINLLSFDKKGAALNFSLKLFFFVGGNFFLLLIKLFGKSILFIDRIDISRYNIYYEGRKLLYQT